MVSGRPEWERWRTQVLFRSGQEGKDDREQIRGVSSDDEEEWVPPTFAASSGAVRRVHQTDLVESPVVRVEIPPVAGRSQSVDDVPVERVVTG